MRRTIGEAAVLSTTLNECVSPCRALQLLDILQNNGRRLQGVLRRDRNTRACTIASHSRTSGHVSIVKTNLTCNQDLDDPSLAPPLVILDHAQILREVMNVYESSLVGDEDTAEQTAGFQRILDVGVDPAIEFCTSNSEEKKRLRPRWDREVYVLNCLSYLQVRFRSLACPRVR